MELYVLGSGTCIPTVDRAPSGLALSFGPHLILLDGGGGSLRQMPRLGLDFRKVDFQCLTHFHPVFGGHDIRKECGQEFSGEILLAVDGMKLNI